MIRCANGNALNINLQLNLSRIMFGANNSDTCCALGHSDVCPVSRKHKLQCSSLKARDFIKGFQGFAFFHGSLCHAARTCQANEEHRVHEITH